MTQLRKWISDAELFLTQWKAEDIGDMSIWPDDLVFGDTEAPLHIIVACSPYCNPCAETHHRLDSLLDRFAGKIKIHLRFICWPGDLQNKYTEAVTGILKVASIIKSKQAEQNMISDWFEFMNYEKWSEKWKPSSIGMQQIGRYDVKERLAQHYEWINNNRIAHTPTLFLNGRKIPGRYNIYDLELLIPQLSEIFLARNR